MLVARDAIYRMLENNDDPAYVITSTSRAADLRALSDRLKADVVLLAVDRTEAHHRADSDGRPAEWHSYIDRWFDETDIRAEDWPQKAWRQSGGKAMRRKTYQGAIELKADGQPGEFRAEFATLNVVDHDGDVTPPGAFHDGQETIIEAWNHNYGELPVGKGVIREVGDKAVIEGVFFLDTAAGMEHYKTVKNLGSLQEWSYTFGVIDASFGKFEGQDVQFLRDLDVWGVAPVERGAGIDTRTVSIKTSHDPAELQAIHDAVCRLGAKCAVSEGEGKAEAGDGNASVYPSTVAARIALELMEMGVG
ncbi:HK97 family phage prohead protease [Patescibacteria group bacterium]|nr:HK97 family phage prohead protease [Patescibacteria group bacterium]